MEKEVSGDAPHIISSHFWPRHCSLHNINKAIVSVSKRNRRLQCNTPYVIGLGLRLQLVRCFRLTDAIPNSLYGRYTISNRVLLHTVGLSVV